MIFDIIDIDDTDYIKPEETVTTKTAKVYRHYIIGFNQAELNANAKKRAAKDILKHLKTKPSTIIGDAYLNDLSLRCRLGTISHEKYSFTLNPEAQNIYKTEFIAQFNTHFSHKFKGLNWDNRLDYCERENDIAEYFEKPSKTVISVIKNYHNIPCTVTITEHELSQYLISPVSKSRIHSILVEFNSEIAPFFLALFSPTRAKAPTETPYHSYYCGLDLGLILMAELAHKNPIVIENALNPFFKLLIKNLRLNQQSINKYLKEQSLLFIQKYIDNFKKMSVISEAYSLSEQYEEMQQWFNAFFENNQELKKEYETNLVQIQNAILSEKDYSGFLFGYSISTLIAKRSSSEFLNFILEKIISPKFIPVQQIPINKPGYNALIAEKKLQFILPMPDFLQSEPEDNYILRVKEPILLRALSLMIEAFPDTNRIDAEENLFIIVMSYYFKNLLDENKTTTLDERFLQYFSNRKSLIFGAQNQILTLLNHLPLYLSTQVINSPIRTSAYKLVETFFGKRFTDFITDASEIVKLDIAIKLFDDPNDIAFFLLPIIFNLKETFLERVANNRVQFIKLYNQLAHLFPKNELFQVRLNQAFTLRYPSALTNHKIVETVLHDGYSASYAKRIEFFKEFMLANATTFGIENNQIELVKNIETLTKEHTPSSLVNIKSAFLVMQQIHAVANNSNENRYRFNLLLDFLGLINKPIDQSDLPAKLTQLSQLDGQCPAMWIDILAQVNDIVIEKNSNEPKDKLNHLFDTTITESARILYNNKTLQRFVYLYLYNQLATAIGHVKTVELLKSNLLLEAHFITFFLSMSIEMRAQHYNDYHTNILFSPIKVEEQINHLKVQQTLLYDVIDKKMVTCAINNEIYELLNQKLEAIITYLPKKNEMIAANSHEELIKEFNKASEQALTTDKNIITEVLKLSIPLIGQVAYEGQLQKAQVKIANEYKKIEFCFPKFVENYKNSTLFDLTTFKELFKKEIIKCTFSEFEKIIAIEDEIDNLNNSHKQVFAICSEVASMWILPIAINRLYQQLTHNKSDRGQHMAMLKLLLKQAPTTKNKKEEEIYQEHFEQMDEHGEDYKLKFSSFLLLLTSSKLIRLDHYEQFFPDYFSIPKKRKVIDLSNEEGFDNGTINSSYPLSFFTPSSPQQNKGYSKLVLSDAYMAFDISRQKALELLLENIINDKVQVLIANALKDALINHTFSGFVNYLIAKEETYSQRWSGKKPSDISQDIRKNLSSLSSNLTIISYYLSFDIAEKGINDGAHPAVLQTLAHILDVSLNIWQIGDNQKLIPHEFSEYARYPAKPNPNQQRIDLLDNLNGNFERLDIVGGFEGDIYPSDQNPSPSRGIKKEPNSLRKEAQKKDRSGLKKPHSFFEKDSKKKQKVENFEIKKEPFV